MAVGRRIARALLPALHTLRTSWTLFIALDAPLSSFTDIVSLRHLNERVADQWTGGVALTYLQLLQPVLTLGRLLLLRFAIFWLSCALDKHDSADGGFAWSLASRVDLRLPILAAQTSVTGRRRVGN